MTRIPLTFVAALLLLNSGCDRVGQSDPTGATQQQSVRRASELDAPRGRPEDFFPMQPGASWRYEIRLGPAEPLGFREVHWKGHGTRVRSRLVRDFQEAQKTVHILELRVKGPAEQPAEPVYTNGVELEVVQDDLKLYEDAKRLFFASSKADSGFEAVLVVTYAPRTDGLGGGGPWGGWGQVDGYSLRHLLFGERPGTGIGFGDEPRDRLVFLGVERTHPQLQGGPFLHFERQVGAEERDSGLQASYLDHGFTEDTWYSHRGLVRLEQHVGGERAMLWTLVSDARGPNAGGKSSRASARTDSL